MVDTVRLYSDVHYDIATMWLLFNIINYIGSDIDNGIDILMETVSTEQFYDSFNDTTSTLLGCIVIGDIMIKYMNIATSLGHGFIGTIAGCSNILIYRSLRNIIEKVITGLRIVMIYVTIYYHSLLNPLLMLYMTFNNIISLSLYVRDALGWKRDYDLMDLKNIGDKFTQFRLYIKNYYRGYDAENDEGIDTLCSICIEPQEEPINGIVIKNCNHYYHYDCINRWLTQCINKSLNLVCPYCKQNI